MTEPRCRERANALLPWYLSGALPREEEIRVRDHVEGCDVCAAELDDLRGVARPARLSGAPPVPPVISTSWPSLMYALPAVLLAPALLGLYWLYLGLPAAPPPPTRAIRQSVSLELGDDSPRNPVQIPSLAVPTDAETVVLSFGSWGTVSGGRALLTLEGPGGVTLARQEYEARPDPGRRMTCAIDAALLRSPGRYIVVVTHLAVQAEDRERRYPFQVLDSASPH